MSERNLPAVIAEKIEGRPYHIEDIGRSGAAVWMFSDMVLKIEEATSTAENEYRILEWLDTKLPTPRVLAFAKENGKQYLLMTRLHGKMACDAEQKPEDVVRGLAGGLKMLWKIDISDCPISWDIEKKLAIAKTKLCQRDDFPALFAELSKERPQETLVFSHGDYCLPNVFLSGEEPVGFLDLGSAGIADKWYDVMMCLWSLRYNFCELGGMAEDVFSEYRNLFFETLGLHPNEDMMHYHARLDEFFM